MRALRALAVAAVLSMAAAVLLLGAALQREPSVVAREEVSPQDVARAVELLRRHDPRHARPGAARQAALQTRDVELLLDQALRRWLQGASHVDLFAGGATVRASLHLPAVLPNPFGRWLNVELQLAGSAGWPTVRALRLGRLPLPATLVAPVLRRWAEHAGVRGELQLAAEVLQQVRFDKGRVTLVYALRDDSPQRVLAALLPPPEQQRLRAYAGRLAELTAAAASGTDLPLADLMGPLFALARQRSANPADAVAENRAALVVLGLFANGVGAHALAPATPPLPRAQPRRLLLAGRDDYPRHFLISAALAAESGGPLSQAIGLYKEVTDARSGSGFSFTDMAANRAGTRFGERAVQDPQRLQAAVAAGVQDHDLVPALADLPEFLPEREFVRRFGGVGAPAYEAQLAEIDRRIGALPLLR